MVPDDFFPRLRRRLERRARMPRAGGGPAGSPTTTGVSHDPQLVQQGLVLLSGAAGVAGGLALDALKDAVKDRLTAYFKRKLEGPLSGKPSIKFWEDYFPAIPQFTCGGGYAP